MTSPRPLYPLPPPGGPALAAAVVVGLSLALTACSSGVPQAESCRALVACARAKDRIAGTTTDVARFDGGGDCWSSGASADVCEEACANGLAFIRAHEPSAPPECQP